jgi:hypothetical protein
MTRKILPFLFATILFIAFGGCEFPFPSVEKENLPKAPYEHKVSEEGVLHREGLEHPLFYNEEKGETNCADSKCHGEELKGGIVKLDGKIKNAPSCYQCHDNIWDRKSKD